MKDFTNKHNYFLVAGSLIILIIGVSLLMPYFEAEYYSDNRKNLIDGNAVCDQYTDTKLKSFKIIKYDMAYRTASLYCFYDNPNYNSLLQMNYQNTKWLTLYSYKLNKPGNFYWPFYI